VHEAIGEGPKPGQTPGVEIEPQRPDADRAQGGCVLGAAHGADRAQPPGREASADASADIAASHQQHGCLAQAAGQGAIHSTCFHAPDYRPRRRCALPGASIPNPMAYTVHVKPSGRQFLAEPDESILDAALRQSIVMPYGCRNGACGSCKARILEGTVEQGAHQPGALRDSELTRGLMLPCCARATSDLVIEARVVAGAGDIPVRKMPCRVSSIERVAPDVVVLRLQLPASERLQFLAGQYIELILKDGTRRSYSMACPPHAAEQLELHVRHMPGGRFTDALFGVTQPAVRERDILRFEGPMGTFFLREDSERPIVLLASGTGFAPIRAIVEHMIHKSITRPAVLYWGGRRPHDLYQRALCERWAAELPAFRFVPVVSDALAEDDWRGRTGFVHRAVIDDLPDLSNHEVYACGAPVMIEAARDEFTRVCGLPADAFFADAFTSAADAAA
jgi:CDP-4-dehydro-6-deoxyglucose reductase